MSTCKLNLDAGDTSEKCFYLHSLIKHKIELTLLLLTGFADSSVTRVLANSISARFAQISNKFDKQSGDSHRANRFGIEDDGTEFKLRRSGASHFEL